VIARPSGLPAVVEALLSPSAYDHPVAGEIEFIQTHISYVLLAGEFAYKIKKPIALGFLDYRTLAQRKRMCEEEVRLNRRLCPEAYLGVVPIVRRDGRVAVGGDGEIAEYAVKMHRIPQSMEMPRLLEQGRVAAADIRRLARLLADFHERAEHGERIAAFGSVESIARNWRENFEQAAPLAAGDDVRPGEARLIDTIRAYVERMLQERAPLFEARIADGRVRDCHGDLRSDSIVIRPDGSICIMDCIEFNDRLRFGDVAGDVGFLAMDLDVRNRRDLADEFTGAYVAASGDETLPLVLPFYRCYRAFVRAKVEGLLAGESDVPQAERDAALVRARRYLALAAEYATAHVAQSLIVMVGMTGSGKSYIANAIAGRIGAAVASSDTARDLLSRRGPEQAYGEGRYTRSQRHAVYDAIRERAAAHLGDGDSVILDATHLGRDDRARAADLAREAGARLAIIQVTADDAATRAHLLARAEDPARRSEGRWEIYERQREFFQPVTSDEGDVVLLLDGAEPLAINAARVIEALA